MKYTSLLFVLLIGSVLTTASGQKPDKTLSKITLSGTVTGLDGSPAADAQIFIDSVDTGFSTNDIGKYRVKVSTGAKMVFAYSFMKGSGEAAIDGRSIVDIVLDPRKDIRPDFSGRSSELKENSASKKTKSKVIYSNIYEMIRAEVPGVLVSGSSIVVQQQNSFLGSAAPLFLVNGVRVNSISNINPAEVKSITLLKGSQAAAYGNEGANGVLSITLLSGGDR
jgi:outer membrane receptor protein involved in Fe transport